jgi:hypothetical protein
MASKPASVLWKSSYSAICECLRTQASYVAFNYPQFSDFVSMAEKRDTLSYIEHQIKGPGGPANPDEAGGTGACHESMEVRS